jgi:uncharacterized protein
MSTDLPATIDTLCASPAIREPLRRLQAELPKSLTYHAYEHTLDVIREAFHLATYDGLSPRQVEIVCVAAAWHDVGFIQRTHNNEPLAAADARVFLSQLGVFTQAEVELIEDMIRDTALVRQPDGIVRQVPSTPLSPYLLDADLANFGRDDFFEKSELQRIEVQEPHELFRVKTATLLEHHRWLTPAAAALWSDKKAENLARLRDQILAASR